MRAPSLKVYGADLIRAVRVAEAFVLDHPGATEHVGQRRCSLYGARNPLAVWRTKAGTIVVAQLP